MLGKKLSATTLALVMSIFSLPAVGQEVAHLKLGDRELYLHIENPLPPYVLIGENRGAELDIVREAFALEGYRLRLVPTDDLFLDQSGTALNTGTSQGYSNSQTSLNSIGMTLAEQGEDALCYSSTYIHYRPVAISLSQRRLIVDGVDDLHSHQIVGPKPGAPLETEISMLFQKLENYHQMDGIREQKELLRSGEADFIVGDLNVFQWRMGSYVEDGKLTPHQSYSVHPVFAPKAKRLTFNDPIACSAFNRGIESLRQSGRYTEILNSYSLL